MAAEDPFGDVLEANRAYADGYALRGIPGSAKQGLAIITCMDSRIEPLAMLGLEPGDAKILRNAGARVTDDVLRALVLGVYLLGVRRAMVIAHTDCRMVASDEEDVHRAIEESGGPDTRSLSFLTTADQAASLRTDVSRIQHWPYLQDVAAGGFLYEVETGRLTRVV